MTKIAIVVAGTLLPSIAFAHPEHGSGGNFGLLHFLGDPFHVGLTAAAVVVFFAVRRSILRRQA